MNSFASKRCTRLTLTIHGKTFDFEYVGHHKWISFDKSVKLVQQGQSRAGFSKNRTKHFLSKNPDRQTSTALADIIIEKRPKQSLGRSKVWVELKFGSKYGVTEKAGSLKFRAWKPINKRMVIQRNRYSKIYV